MGEGLEHVCTRTHTCMCLKVSTHIGTMFSYKRIHPNTYQRISVTKLQAVAAGVRENQEWNPWWRNMAEYSEHPGKPMDAHKLLVTFTDASRDLHGIFT